MATAVDTPRLASDRVVRALIVGVTEAGHSMLTGGVLRHLELEHEAVRPGDGRLAHVQVGDGVARAGVLDQMHARPTGCAKREHGDTAGRVGGDGTGVAVVVEDTADALVGRRAHPDHLHGDRRARRPTLRRDRHLPHDQEPTLGDLHTVDDRVEVMQPAEVDRRLEADAESA